MKNLTQFNIIMKDETFGLIPRLKNHNYEIYHDEIRILFELFIEFKDDLYSKNPINREVIPTMFELISELYESKDSDLIQLASDLVDIIVNKGI